jgi:FKBP-type peptidyl-prolyl cis-trans isomerase
LYSRVLAMAAAMALVVGSVTAQDTAKPKTAPAAKPAQAPAATPKPAAVAPIGNLKDLTQQASYAFGLNVGRQLKANTGQLSLDPKTVIQAIADGLNDAKPQMTEAQCQTALEEFQKVLLAKEVEKANVNKKAGEAFLAANKKKAGVKTTASGLQYIVAKEGTGPIPKASDTVTTHYRGTLIDGTEFDSSYKRGEPTSFPVNGVIPGWSEALQLMKVGSKYQLFIPSELAYQERGTPDGAIPPNSTLIFEVELLKIEKPQPNPAP